MCGISEGRSRAGFSGNVRFLWRFTGFKAIKRFDKSLEENL